jgi:hypothetical protein
MKRINDSNVRLVFTPSRECQRDHGAEKVAYVPDELFVYNASRCENDTDFPRCDLCGNHYNYSHTEIKERTATVHVRGGVAYGPSRSTNGVAVRIKDHDNH